MRPGTIGLDVGGTKCWALLALDDESVSAPPVFESRTPVVQGRSGLADTVRRSLADTISAAKERGVDVRGAGVGLPGLVDSAGTLLFAPHLPGVEGLPVRVLLEDEFGIPVVADNDASLAALAEFASVSESPGEVVMPRRLLMITFGTGIGGGFVYDGKIEGGAHGFSGEIGHMVVERNGLACSCGRRGCWETRASGNALGALGRRRAASQRAPGIVALAGGDVAAVRGEHVAAAARAGDPDALMLLAEWADSVAVGLANLTNIIDPDCFVLGGGLADIADLWLEGVRRRHGVHLNGAALRPRVEIRVAQLGSQAGAKGAALAARGASRA